MTRKEAENRLNRMSVDNIVHWLNDYIADPFGTPDDTYPRICEYESTDDWAAILTMIRESGRSFHDTLNSSPNFHGDGARWLAYQNAKLYTFTTRQELFERFISKRDCIDLILTDGGVDTLGNCDFE